MVPALKLLSLVGQKDKEHNVKKEKHNVIKISVTCYGAQTQCIKPEIQEKLI